MRKIILFKQKITFFALLFLAPIVVHAQFTGGDGSGYSTSQPVTGLLPVTWGDFSVVCNGNSSALLSWETLNEINTSHFDVYRSFDGDDFEWKGRVTAAGNAFETKNYSYEDPFVFMHNTPVAYYALVQVNLDGSFSRFPTPIVLFNSCGIKHSKQLVHVSTFGISNGFRATMLINDVSYVYKVYDVTGRVHAEGEMNETRDFLSLKPGVYYFSVQSSMGGETVKVLVF